MAGPTNKVWELDSEGQYAETSVREYRSSNASSALTSVTVLPAFVPSTTPSGRGLSEAGFAVVVLTDASGDYASFLARRSPGDRFWEIADTSPLRSPSQCLDALLRLGDGIVVMGDEFAVWIANEASNSAVLAYSPGDFKVALENGERLTPGRPYPFQYATLPISVTH